MESFLDITIKAIPVTALVGGLAAWLGQVWATRIASKDSANLTKELDKLRTSLDLQKNMLQQAHQNASLDSSEISREQITAIKIFWNHWLDFRSETIKFRTPHQILKVSELNDPATFARIFPYTADVLDNSMKISMAKLREIESLRPLLPVQIYQHFIGLSTLYLRLGIRLTLNVKKGSKIIEWYADESGGYDFSVIGLINYAKSQSISLLDPKIGGESYLTLSKWKEVLEEKLIELIYQYINGSLARQIEIHSAIRSLAEKQETKAI